MKPQELRIGNWYLSTKFQVPVICELGDFYELYARLDGADAEPEIGEIFQPLSLTEDWLVAFGFEISDQEYSGGWGYEIKGVLWDNCVLQQDDKFFYFYEVDDYWYSWKGIEIKSVHQLQNYIYALTGEELALDEKAKNRVIGTQTPPSNT